MRMSDLSDREKAKQILAKFEVLPKTKAKKKKPARGGGRP